MCSVKKTPVYKLSMIALSLLSLYSSASGAVSDTELNTVFLQGTQFVPSILKKGAKFPAGEYYVDVIVNNDNVGKSKLNISSEEELSGELCFSPEWLASSGVLINLDEYTSEYNKLKHCYNLSRDLYTHVKFNYGNQSLIFSIPQANIISRTDPRQWDYGINAFRLQYQGNVAHLSGKETTAYGSGDVNINLGRWVVSSNMSGNRNSDGRSDFAVRDATLSTAISSLRSDFRVGKVWTRNELFNDFGFYGASLRSNSSMTPWESRGYAPLISGIATTTSRISITQNGYTIYSRVVQPGPYELTDVRSVGNGDLVVTVEDASGKKTSTTYPVTTLPTLLRHGELQYDVSIGRKSSNSDINKPFTDGDQGIFWSGSLAYGLGGTTLGAATILHNKYHAGGINITQSLGELGAISVGGALSQADYDNHQILRGHSISAKYAKSFSDKTNLHLMAYRYQSRDYVEFSNFNPTYIYGRNIDKQKSRYEMQLTQRLSTMSNLNFSAWREDYWQHSGHAVGATLGTGFTLFDNVSFSVNAGYNEAPYQAKPDYTAALSMSVPFNLGGVRHYSHSSVGYSSVSGTQFRNSVSASDDRISYTASATASDKGARSVSAGIGYEFDSASVGVGVTQDRNNTGISGDFSGSIVVTGESGLLMTRDRSNTQGVVRIADIPNVRFNGSPETNSRGYTVVGLSDYSQNSIDIDMESVPDNLELDVTSFRVVPTERSVVYRDFGANYVKRYFLQVKNNLGELLDGGNAKTEQGVDAGFISRNGVLSMGLLSEPSLLKVSLYGGKECIIDMKGVKNNVNTVQEVRCE